MKSDLDRRNKEIFDKKIKKFLDNVLERNLMQLLEFIGKYVKDWVKSESAAYWENDTYNLRDSIGAGLYKNGRLVKFIGNPAKASSPAKYTYHGVQYTMSGRRKLMTALGNNHLANSGKYVLAIFCEAPYGFFLEHGLGPEPLSSGDDSKKGFGWWSNGLVPYVQERFEVQLAIFKNEVKSIK